MSLFLWHPPLHSFILSFPPPFPHFLSIPLLISPSQSTIRALQWIRWLQHDTAQSTFPMSLQTGLCCVYLHYKQHVDSSSQWGGTGLFSAPHFQGSTYLRPISGPRCLSSQLTLHPRWTHLYRDIFLILGSWYVEAQLSLYRTCHKPKGKVCVISPLFYTRLYHSKAKGASLYLMHTFLGIYYCLELLIFKQYQEANNSTAFESLKFTGMF